MRRRGRGTTPRRAERAPHAGRLRGLGPTVFLFVLTLAFRAFAFEPRTVPSGSMLPSLQVGDYVIVTKFAYGFRVPFTDTLAWQRALPGRGDVVVFAPPHRDGDDLIKRVVGLPGDEVVLRDGVVHVDGVPQPRELVAARFTFLDHHEASGAWFPARGSLHVESLLPRDGGPPARHLVIQQRPHPAIEGPFLVPEGHVFVLGDNRDDSADSRAGGWFVPLGHIRGRADAVGFSWGPRGFRTDRFFRELDDGVPPS